jgi:small GTP-binding protein
MLPRLSQSFNGVLVLIMAAVAAYFLVNVSGTIIDYYNKAAAHSALIAYLYLAAVSLGLLIFAAIYLKIGLALIRNTRRKKKRVEQQILDPSQMTDRQIEEAIQSQINEVSRVSDVLDQAGADRGGLDEAVATLEHKRASQTLEIIAFGTISSGKSALLNALCGREVFKTSVRGGTTTTRNEVPWTGGDRVMLVDTPGIGEVDNETHAQIAKDSAHNADLVLLVLDGPLRESEFETLKVLGALKKPLHVCLNKTDWYGDQQKDALLRQIAKQVRPWVDPRDVTSVQAKPIHQTRIHVGADGSEEKQQIDVPPDIGILARRMLGTIDRDGRDMLLANLLLRSRALAGDARDQVQEALDNRAHDIVYLYMWRAGAAAAVIPMPLVDIAAGVTISTKMVLELAKTYNQEIDLKTAEQMLKEMSKNLVGILGSHAVTPIIGTTIGSALKSVPGIGTLTGGAIQGLTQALVTRWIGLVFIDYFKNEMRPPKGGLPGLARRQWGQVSQAKEIADMALARLAEARAEAADGKQG